MSTCASRVAKLGTLITLVVFGTCLDVEGRIIRNVHVNRGNIFVGDEIKTGVDRAINSFHSLTRESVIRRELAFAEGDTLDMDLIEEGERNLRDLDFFSLAEISVENVGVDSVDVIVTTRDQWTIFPGFVLASGGGVTEVGAFVDEYNLLGFGKHLFVEGVNESDVGTRWSFGYTDPQFLGKRLDLYSITSTGPLVKGYELFLKRPFYSVDTKWSFGAGGYVTDEVRRLFGGGEEVSRFKFNSDHFSTFASRAFGERFKKVRVTLEYRYEKFDLYIRLSNRAKGGRLRKPYLCPDNQ